MLGALIWRTKEAIAVFLGKKKTQRDLPKPNYPKISAETQPVYQFEDKDLERYINSKSIEFIFSEFNEDRVNAGGADLSKHSRLDPSLTSLRKYFPNAKYTVYSDFDLNIEGVILKKLNPPVLQDKKHLKRHFYHLADYYKFKGMVESDADIAIAIDSDMFVWNEEIFRLVYLTDKFGFCVPTSSGRSMNFEVESSLDTASITDESNGYGTTCNITPMSLAKHSERGKQYFEACCEEMEKEPYRASIIMWKAAWKTGIYPYCLPKEFCVVRGLQGIGHEVLLHVGHREVSDYYNVEV